MTSKPRKPSTRPARWRKKVPKLLPPAPTPSFYDWLSDSDMFPTPTPISEPQYQDGEYVKTGLCSYCHGVIIAKQPGGLDPKHRDTGVPYGLCRTKS